MFQIKWKGGGIRLMNFNSRRRQHIGKFPPSKSRRWTRFLSGCKIKWNDPNIGQVSGVMYHYCSLVHFTVARDMSKSTLTHRPLNCHKVTPTQLYLVVNECRQLYTNSYWHKVIVWKTCIH